MDTHAIPGTHEHYHTFTGLSPTFSSIPIDEVRASTSHARAQLATSVAQPVLVTRTQESVLSIPAEEAVNMQEIAGPLREESTLSATSLEEDEDLRRMLLAEQGENASEEELALQPSATVHCGIMRVIIAGLLYLLTAIACMFYVYVFCVDNENSTVLEALFTGVYLAIMGLLVLSIALFISYLVCAGWTIQYR